MVWFITLDFTVSAVSEIVTINISSNNADEFSEYDKIDTKINVLNEPSVEYITLTPENENKIFNLVVSYYLQNKNKELAKQYIGKYKTDHVGKIIIEIWAGIFNTVEERAIAACYEKRENANFIKRLLIHHQKSLVDKLFHNFEFGKRLREQYKVLYYISQILVGKGNENNLLLRIPPEMESTVTDVLKHIEEEQKRYST